MARRQWQKKGFLTSDGMLLLVLMDESNEDLQSAFPGSTLSSLKKAQRKYGAMLARYEVSLRERPISDMVIRTNGRTGVQSFVGGRITINYGNGKVKTNLGKDLSGDHWWTIDRHNAMCRAYSDMYGSKGETQEEIAREFDFLSSRHVRRYLSVWGIFHASIPQSDIELSDPDFDVDAAAEENVASRRNAVFTKTRLLQWKETEKAAESFWSLEQTILKPMAREMTQLLEKGYGVPRLELMGEASDPYVLLAGLSDVHFGKFATGVNGEILYNMDIAERELENTLMGLLAQVELFGTPEYFIVTMGTDNFHVDTVATTTTRGTPQDFDGTVDIAIPRYSVAMLKFIDTLRVLAPVKVVVFKGNHDKMASMWLGEILRAKYDDKEDVEIIFPTSARAYLQVGNSCLGFTHGDPEFRSAGKQKANVHKLMLLEPPMHGISLDEIDFMTFFGGNLHFENTVDFGGVVYEQFIAFCGDDIWHEENVFIGARKALVGYVISFTGGIRAKLYANARLGE